MAAPINHGSGRALLINNIDFAKKALQIHAIITDSQLPRLHDSLAKLGSELDCRLIGKVDQERQLVLELTVQGKIWLDCQRCLEPFEFDVNIHSTFFIVADESEIPPDDEENEGEYLVAEEQMRLVDLIEDELLLALPLAPKHIGQNCIARGKLNELKRPSPFAVLGTLKAGGLKSGKNQD